MPVTIPFFLRQLVLGLIVFLWFPTSLLLSWPYGRYLLSISFDGRAILLTTFPSLVLFFFPSEKKIKVTLITSLINPLKISKITMMFTPLVTIFAARLSFNDPLSFKGFLKFISYCLEVKNTNVRLKFCLPLFPRVSFYKSTVPLWAPLFLIIPCQIHPIVPNTHLFFNFFP